VERFNRRWVTVEENQKLQQRVSELEAENAKLKNRNDFVRELIGLMAGNNWFRANSKEIKSENGNSLEQVIELARDLSNDIRNIMKTVNKINTGNNE
jgi:hypothetical protein